MGKLKNIDQKLKTKKAKRNAIFLGVALAVGCQMMPPHYRGLCMTVTKITATSCGG